MQWDTKLDLMFKELDSLLQPNHIVNQDVVYRVFKNIRDIMKELQKEIELTDERTGCF